MSESEAKQILKDYLQTTYQATVGTDYRIMQPYLHGTYWSFDLSSGGLSTKIVTAAYQVDIATRQVVNDPNQNS